MNNQKGQFSMIGLGVMGSNLLLNIADHGFSVVGYDRDPKKGELLKEQAGNRPIQVVNDMSSLVNSLQTPRVIMLLVPAGKPVDDVIQELEPHLESGDILIDGGNSYFLDTERRQRQLEQKGLHLLGIGVSGGEKGARIGPCMMPGGSQAAYEKVRPILEAAAARFADYPCIAYLGPKGAGHYVKMVHNGIEYGLMQLISETYDMLKTGLELDPEALAHLYSKWDQNTDTSSYLLKITADIFRYIDPETKGFLVDHVLDIAEEKGTGSWTSEQSMFLHEPATIIDAAVAMRDLSAFRSFRLRASEELKGPSKKYKGDKEAFMQRLHRAFYMGMILTYTQGMSILQTASRVYQYGLNLDNIAHIWRGGCIIRSDLLDQIVVAYQRNPKLPTLLQDPYFIQELSSCQEDLRKVIEEIIPLGIPLTGFTAALSYYDAFRSRQLPANLIQAQRDSFGSHTYKRIDKEGIFHTDWSPKSLSS